MADSSRKGDIAVKQGLCVHLSTRLATALSASLEGERLDPARHELVLEIKAVTWHRLKIEPDERPGWFRATVALDV